jgi:hypothetical protein
MRRRRSRSLAMGGVKRAEVILLLAVGLSHRKVRQGSRRPGPHYPQGHQAVNILESGLADWFAGVAGDLWRCLTGWEVHGCVELFRLGVDLDDLQWPDRAKLNLLEHLGGNSFFAIQAFTEPAGEGCLHLTKSRAMIAAKTQENDADPSFRNAN